MTDATEGTRLDVPSSTAGGEPTAAPEDRTPRKRADKGTRPPANQPSHRGRPRLLPEQVRARIRAEREAGKSLRNIAAGLTEDGIPTAQGGQWWAATIRKLLES